MEQNTPELERTPNISEEDLAYIIYTSGSTGQPKGIMHTHRSCLDFCRWANTAYGLRASDRFSNQAAMHFDMSIFELFAAAVAGATTVIIPDDYLRMPASLSSLLSSERITVVFSVPFALSQLLFNGVLDKRDMSALRWVIFGGDNHTPSHIRQLMELLPHTQFSHMYGPAETNGCTFMYLDGPPSDSCAAISIGAPCQGMQALVLDDKGGVVGEGETGELLIRGSTMMKGYWNRPELNEKVFYTEPTSCGGKYYRTGDLVEVLSKGNLRFVGRSDRQLKVRGFRIELDEVEMALSAHSHVKEAAAYPVETKVGGMTIECAVTLHEGASSTGVGLLKYLKELLPRYAVPSRVLDMAVLPRMQSGKIDRRLLQANAQALSNGDSISAAP